MIPDIKVKTSDPEWNAKAEAYLRENLPDMNWENERAVNALYFDLMTKENHPFDLLNFSEI